MSEIAVNVAVIRDQKILLTQREDFETWILPGGGVEAGESLAHAAIRETKEETGLDVELTRLVGVYSRLGNARTGHVVLFVASPVGGETGRQPGETIAVEWFPFDQIPAPLHLGHTRRIKDAVSGKGGSVCVTQEFDMPNYPKDMQREELYALRDRSGLTRQEFYLRMIEGGSYNERIEVGDNNG